MIVIIKKNKVNNQYDDGDHEDDNNNNNKTADFSPVPASGELDEAYASSSILPIRSVKT